MSNLTTPEERLKTYMARLRNELNMAHAHYEIAKLLRESHRMRPLDFREAGFVFQLTQNANLFAVVMTIFRFLDQSDDSMQLYSFFELVRDNLDLFTASAFRKRLLNMGMDAEEVEDWTGKYSEITRQGVDADEAKVRNMPVRNLKIWRHKRLAHIDRKLALKEANIMQSYPVTAKEIDDILAVLDETLNRYSVAYDGRQWLIGVPAVKGEIECIMDSIKLLRESR